MRPQIEHIRIPDELKFVLNSACKNFPRLARIEGDDITLKGLTEKQKLVTSFFQLPAVADEVIDNLNLVIADLGTLAKSARAFGDERPFSRYKLIVRMFYYEFSRFEDIFGYYTLWLQRRKYLTKDARKKLRDDFYREHEPFIRVRNLFMHDDPTWKGHCTPEIAILQGLDLFGYEVRDKSGQLLTWEPHLGPLCLKMQSIFYEAGRSMQVTWSMLTAHAVHLLVQDGKLTKANKRFKPTISPPLRSAEP
ncbi:MAG: hypothetical protein WC073_12035 [Sterolibacterium sp.]